MACSYKRSASGSRPSIRAISAPTSATRSLELSGPVIGLRPRQGRISRQVALELPLIELPIVKAPERRRQAAERPDEPELRGDEVGDEAETDLPRELESILHLALRLGERIAG